MSRGTKASWEIESNMAANSKSHKKLSTKSSEQEELSGEVPPFEKSKCFIVLPRPPRVVWYGLTASFALLCYINSIWCQLVHDDVFAIKENKDIHPNSSLLELLKNDFWGKKMADNTSHKSYRPLCVLTFRLNFMIHGLDPLGYHVVNVLCHILVCLVFVYFLEKNVYKNVRLSAITGILFACHPVHTEAVTGVVGRADVLASLLVILSLECYIRASYEFNSPGDTSFCHPVYMMCCLVLGTMAMLTKEQGITVFGVCLLYDAYVISNIYHRFIRGNGLLDIVKSRKYFLTRTMILTFMVGLLLSFRVWIMNGSLPQFIKQDNPASFSQSIQTRALTYCYLFAFNSWLLLSPSKLSYDWQGGSIPLVESLWDLRNLGTVGFFLVMGCLVYFCLLNYRVKRNDQNIIFIGLLLMVVPFLPASNLFFRVGFVVAERILYIPSLGFCILVTCGANKLAASLYGVAQRRHKSSEIITLLLVTMVTMFCWKTIARNRVWQNREMLFRSGVETLPHNAKAHYNYGNFLKDSGDEQAAKQHYTAALELEPDYVSAHNNLGTLLKDDQEAIQHFQAALRSDNMHANSYFNLGVRFSNLHNYDAAVKALKEAIRIRAGYMDAMMRLAGVLADQGKEQEARQAYEEVISRYPSNPDTYNNYGVHLAGKGDVQSALQLYRKAIKLNPDHSVAYVNMARLLKSEGKVMDAEAAFKKALSLKHEAATLQLLGVLYYNQDKLVEAERAWKEALAMRPNDEEMLSNMGVLYSRTGRVLEAIQVCKGLVNQHPNKPAHYKNLANVLGQAGRPTEAVEIISKVLTRFHDADLYFQHGNLLKDLNNMNAAKQSFMKAVELDHRHAGAHMNLGVILHMEKNYASARKHYEAAAKLDPHNKVLKQNLAKLSRVEKA